MWTGWNGGSRESFRCRAPGQRGRHGERRAGSIAKAGEEVVLLAGLAMAAGLTGKREGHTCAAVRGRSSAGRAHDAGGIRHRRLDRASGGGSCRAGACAGAIPWGVLATQSARVRDGRRAGRDAVSAWRRARPVFRGSLRQGLRQGSVLRALARGSRFRAPRSIDPKGSTSATARRSFLAERFGGS